MKKIGLIIALSLPVHLIFGQKQNSIGGEISYSYNNFNLLEQKGFSKNTDGNTNSAILLTKFRKPINQTEKLNLDLGLGLSHDATSFNPFMPLDELNFSQEPGYDTLAVGLVQKNNWNLAGSLGIAYTVFPCTGKMLPGINLELSISGNKTLGNPVIYPYLTYSYNDIINTAYIYNDPGLENKVSDYYKNFYSGYQFASKIGVEAYYEYDNYMISGGFRYNYFFSSPLDYRVQNDPSFSVFISMLFKV